ncbi:peptide-methionine (S)-S-oxide reductase, partial [bacterium]|nr:peptide-methionine (S)-S-oxide reductase [bacterium]
FLNRWFIFKRTAAIASFDLPLVAELPLPPIPAKLDTRIYKKFKDSMTKEDPSYANYITVESSDYSVLKPWHREQVKQVLESWFPNKNEIRSILDGTTHIGVDAIYLSELFPDALINAYEIVPETMVALRINIKTFGKEDRIVPHLQDITTWNPNKNVDILFVDPPWGGHGYKKVKELNLYLQEEGAAPDENKNIKTDSAYNSMEKTINVDTATFGAGCFWCVEAQFQLLDGVLKVISGFSGGIVKNPTYKEVCNGNTGHAEVCQILFDPTKISYDELLAAFWQSHDPTQLNRQGNDFGTQYRSVIFYHNPEQKELAEKYKKELTESKTFDYPVVTEISSA